MCIPLVNKVPYSGRTKSLCECNKVRWGSKLKMKPSIAEAWAGTGLKSESRKVQNHIQNVYQYYFLLLPEKKKIEFWNLAIAGKVPSVLKYFKSVCILLWMLTARCFIRQASTTEGCIVTWIQAFLFNIRTLPMMRKIIKKMENSRLRLYAGMVTEMK